MMEFLLPIIQIVKVGVKSQTISNHRLYNGLQTLQSVQPRKYWVLLCTVYRNAEGAEFIRIKDPEAEKMLKQKS
jgi:hypothetical protein